MSTSLRKSLALASAVAAGSFAIFGAASPATASHPGPANSKLTATSPSGTIVGLSITLVPHICPFDTGCFDATVKDAQWSPDGSRAVFVDTAHDDTLGTVRYSAGNTGWLVQDGISGVHRASPTYFGSGDAVAWAENSADTGGHWAIMASPSSYGFAPEQITPGTPITPSTDDYTDPDGSSDGRVVAEFNGTSITLWNGTSWSSIIPQGTDPAFSPDGTKVAYVNGGQIWVHTLSGGADTQVTNDASAAFTNPTWSPDGSTIAFNSGTAIRSAAAASTGASSLVSGISGTPAYQSQKKDRAQRMAGANRFGTAASASQSYWATKGDASDTRHVAKSVVLSRSDTFADALGGSSLAAAKEGPLLLTLPTSLNVTTAAEIDRILNSGDTVYILGGTGAISTGVENTIKSKGYKTVRLAGSNRYDTAIQIADEIVGDTEQPGGIIFATGMNFPDALGAGAAAGSFDVPGRVGPNEKVVVLLTNDKTMPAVTKNYVDQFASSALLVAAGGQAYTAAANLYNDVIPLVGSNRYETAYWVAYFFFGGQHQAGIATGVDWPDALAGGGLMASLNGPLLLTTAGTGATTAWTNRAMTEESTSIEDLLVFGGSSVVSDQHLNGYGTLISGPLGFTTGGFQFPASLAAHASLRSTSDLGTAKSLKELTERAKDLPRS